MFVSDHACEYFNFVRYLPKEDIKLISKLTLPISSLLKLIHSFELFGSVKMSSNLLLKNTLRSIRVLKIFGFASITIEDEKSVTKPTDIVLFVGNLLFGSVLVHESIKYRRDLIASDSEIVQYGNFVTCVASIGVSLTSMLLAFLFRHKIWNMILELKKVDETIEKYGVIVSGDFHTKVERWYKICVILIVSITILLNGAIYIVEKSLLKSLLYFYSGAYFVLSVGSVVGIMNGARIRIKVINKVLEESLITPIGIEAVDSIKKSIGRTSVLRVSMDVYCKLMRVYDDINVCYGIPTMLGFGFLFFYSIFTSFMVYKDYSSYGGLKGVTIMSLLYSCYLHLFTSLVLFLCTLTENEAVKTLKLLNAVLKRTKDEMEVAMLISFSSYVKRRSPKFTCGLFDFDWTLLYSVRM